MLRLTRHGEGEADHLARCEAPEPLAVAGGFDDAGDRNREPLDGLVVRDDSDAASRVAPLTREQQRDELARP